MLRIYDLGKKKLLRKCESRSIPNRICSIECQESRIIVTDIQESAFYAQYNQVENRIFVFADDSIPRWVTASCTLDYDTIAIADKFGNFSVGRVPKMASDEIEGDPTGNKLTYHKPHLHGAPFKVCFTL